MLEGRGEKVRKRMCYNVLSIMVASPAAPFLAAGVKQT
jgi:hypothetical protein